MNTEPPNQSLLTFILSESAPLVAGTYYATNSVGDAGKMTVFGAYSVYDANCNRVFQESFTGGSVTLTAVDGIAISGSFELSFPSGDQLAGQFVAPLCYVFIPQVGIVNPPPTCSH